MGNAESREAVSESRVSMCVHNRPFDEQSQPRIVIETHILVVLLERV